MQYKLAINRTILLGSSRRPLTVATFVDQDRFPVVFCYKVREAEAVAVGDLRNALHATRGTRRGARKQNAITSNTQL